MLTLVHLLDMSIEEPSHLIAEPSANASGEYERFPSHGPAKILDGSCWDRLTPVGEVDV